MNAFDDILAYEIAIEEAFCTTSYQDHQGNWTVGIGHLLGKESKFANIKWTPIQVMITFMQDLNSAIYYAHRQFPVLDQLSPARQRVLVNMMFNMGPNRLAGFINTTAAVNMFDYQTAYVEMLDSEWAREDVPERANRLAQQWLNG